MKFKTTISPAQKAADKIRKRADGINKTMTSKLGEATLLLHSEAVKGIMTQSSGEVQIRYNPKRERVASKPGDPPNVDTKVFVSSVQFEIDFKEKIGYVGSNDKRAVMFEFGTRNMAARPWLTPALAKSIDRIRQLFKNFGSSGKDGE